MEQNISPAEYSAAQQTVLKTLSSTSFWEAALSDSSQSLSIGMPPDSVPVLPFFVYAHFWKDSEEGELSHPMALNAMHMPVTPKFMSVVQASLIPPDSYP